MQMSVQQALNLLDRPEAQPLPWPMFDARRRIDAIAASLTFIGVDLSEEEVNPTVARATREWAGRAWRCPICGDQNCEGFCDD